MIGLNSTVDIYRATTAQNDLGEPIKTWAVSSSSVSARIVTVTTREREALRIVGGGEAEVAEYRILFAAGTDVVAGDRIKYSGKYYKVLGVTDIDKMGHHLEALAVHVEGLV